MQATSGLAAPARERFYRPELDLLRFCAFAMVFLFHVSPLQHGAPRAYLALRATGATGIEIFFTLSAYLITELLQRERARTGAIDLRAFYVRRMLRIWPLFFTVLLGAIMISHLNARSMDAQTIASYALMLGNWNAVTYGMLAFGFGPLWTISIEEQFYAVFPILARAASSVRLRWICVVTWLASQVAVASLCARHAPLIPTIWADTFTYLQYFAVGAFVSLTLGGRIPGWRPPTRVALLAAAAATLYAANIMLVYPAARGGDATLPWTFLGYGTIGLGTGLLVIGTAGATIPRIFTGFVRLGKISYGLYLLHLPCLYLCAGLASALHAPPLASALSPLAAFALTVGLAAASYRFLEAPFLRLKSRHEIVASRPV